MCTVVCSINIGNRALCPFMFLKTLKNILKIFMQKKQIFLLKIIICQNSLLSLHNVEIQWKQPNSTHHFR